MDSAVPEQICDFQRSSYLQLFAVNFLQNNLFSKYWRGAAKYLRPTLVALAAVVVHAFLAEVD